MINKLVIENLRHRPVRTLLSVVAIGVEVTMILTLVGLCRGMLDESQRRARGAGADIWVRPPGSSVISLSSAPMPEKILTFFQQQPHVVLATGTMSQVLRGVESITGIDIDAFERMSGGLRFLSGGRFANQFDVVVDERYATQHKLRVGDTIRLLGKPWRVCGIVEPGKLARVMVRLPLLQELTSNTGKVSQILLKVDRKENVDKVVDTLKAHPQLEGYGIYSIEEFTSMFSVGNVPGLSEFIGVVIALSVIVGFLVVFLSMYTAVLERTREVGILKSLGATPGFVLSMLVRETALLALTGTALGIVLTYGTRWLVSFLVPASLTQKIVSDWWPIAAAIAIGGAMLGSLYPGWKAVRQDALEALSYE